MFVAFENRLVNLDAIVSAQRKFEGIPGSTRTKVILQPAVGQEITLSSPTAELVWAELMTNAKPLEFPAELDELDALTAPTPPPMTPAGT